MTINNNYIALPILLSVRGFSFLVFLLFFQSLTLDARFNSLGARKCYFHSFVQISVSDYIVHLDRARSSRLASSLVNIFVIGN